MPTYRYTGSRKEYFVESTRFPKDVSVPVLFFINQNVHPDIEKVSDSPLFEPLLYSECHEDTTGGTFEFKVRENVTDYINPVILEVKCYTRATMYINSLAGKSVELNQEIWSHAMSQLLIDKLILQWNDSGKIVVNLERSVLR
jgi:hypothetical protein